MRNHSMTTCKNGIPKKRQTMIDQMVVNVWWKYTVVRMKWVPATHMLAGTLTEDLPMTETFWKTSDWKTFLEPQHGVCTASTAATTAPKRAPMMELPQ